MPLNDLHRACGCGAGGRPDWVEAERLLTMPEGQAGAHYRAAAHTIELVRCKELLKGKGAQGCDDRLKGR